MQLDNDTRTPFAENERTELAEPKRRRIAPGHIVILVIAGVLATGCMVMGIGSKVGLFGGKTSDQASTAPKAAPTAAVAPPKLGLAFASTAASDATAGRDRGLCNGMRLPPNMPCPESAQPNAGSASTPGGNDNARNGGRQPANSGSASGAPPVDKVRERRFGGDLSVAAATAGNPAGQPATEGVLCAGLKLPAGMVCPSPMSAPAPAGDNAMAAARLGTAPATAQPRLSSTGSQFATQTPSVIAKYMLNQDLTLARGTLPDCTLRSAIHTAKPGPISCMLSEPVYSMNGKVVLLEAGTLVSGEYRQGLSSGERAIYAVWVDARTPSGVVVEFNSPSVGPLGTVGMTGDIDSRWMERFAGAVLFSVFDDVMNIELAKAGQGGGNNNISLYPQSANTGKAIVEEMLKQGSNVKPELYKNQGEIVRISVARDIDFSHVYQLQPMAQVTTQQP